MTDTASFQISSPRTCCHHRLPRTLVRALLLVAWILAIPAAHASDPFDRAREEIEKGLEKDQIPSLAVAVAHRGKIVWEQGFGWANKEKQIKATPHTPYSIASISKPITATGLMVLVEQDKVQLDRPANDYLGEAKLTAREGSVAEATVRRLANHTAGLPLHYQFFYADEPHRKPDMDESIRRYGHLLCAPGEEYQYANFGYGLLDHIIARQSGMSYAQFMQKKVFEPLGMKQTAIGIPEGLEEQAAVRYSPRGDAIPFYDFDHPGASAVFSSAHDLALFGMSHLAQPPQEGHEPLLSPSTIEEMQKGTGNVGPGQSYGVGWFINEDEHGYRTVSHTGGMGGVRCRLVLVPSEQIVAVALCNASTDLPLRITREMLAALLPEYGTSYRKFREHQPGPDPGRPGAPDELTGFWQGTLETYVGSRPLQMWVQKDGDIKIRLDGGLQALVNSSRLRNGLLTGEFVGSMGTEDADRRPHHLHLRLKLRGEQLSGAITAISLPGRRAGNALSHWAQLKRMDPSPDVMVLFNGSNLDGWQIPDEIDFERHGKVEVKNGEVHLGAGRPATGIAYTGLPPRMNYELSLEAKRIDGSDFFCGLTFPVGKDYLSLILGGWGGGVTGLSNLDGASAVENETTGHEDFESNRWYAVRLRVTPEKVQVWLDGKSLIDVETKDRKLSIWWEQEPMRPLGIATWNTTAAIRNLQIKRLP